RMTVVEAAAGEIAFAIDDFDDAAGLRAHVGLLDHLLEDPRMRRAALGLEVDDGELCGFGFHAAILIGWASAHRLSVSTVHRWAGDHRIAIRAPRRYFRPVEGE